MSTSDARTAPSAAVQLTAVSKVYGKRRREVVALDDVSIGFGRGAFTAVMGPSGSGKSTMLHCAAGLDRATSGSVHLDHQDLGELKEKQLTVLRRERIGFIFQAFNLLPALTVAQNVLLPLELAGRRPDRVRLSQILERVGLSERGRHRPAELSGGQQQRVAIARALITEPAVVFADEPTGALDTRTGRDVLGLLRETVEDAGQTIVMVTHDPVAASYADRVVFLADGRVAGEIRQPTAEAVAEQMTHLGAWADQGPAPSKDGGRR
ncbi:ABC transporter ATP-binding protein [Leucobacter sp. GX24907]